MVTFTAEEESKHAFLEKEGYSELANLSRSCSTRAHETFEKLSKADLTAVYGPTISDEWMDSMRRTIASGDHALVRSMHDYLISLKEKNEEAAEVRSKESAVNSAPVSLVICGVAIAILSVVTFAVAIFIGS